LFARKFAFGLPARVNFVGGGGKTSLILRLQEEYAAAMPVVYTTTTRIHPPHPAEGLVVISCNREDVLVMLLGNAAAAGAFCRKFVVTGLSGGPNLLRGVSTAFGERLDRDLFPLVLNEADGSRSISLKMPRSGEPVLMDSAEYLVPVIGLDCLGTPLGPNSVFRWDVAERHFGAQAGATITPRLAASILLHPKGVCRDWRPGTHIVPYINKADTESDADSARSLALALLKNGDYPVHRVVWGSLQNGTADCLDRESIQ
jgi:probable selenium-dependent hydroxylase accessory protein YqeC